MTRYSPIWSTIVDSSLWLEEDFVVKVFLTMIAKKDLDDVVRGSAHAISRWANKTEEETLKAIKILSNPDKRRIEPQKYDGRRIQKVEDGWLVLNGAYYRKLTQKANRREYQRVWQQTYREELKSELKKASAGKPEEAQRVVELDTALRHNEH